MTSDQKKAIVQEMVEEMLSVERFSKRDFANKWQYGPAIFGDLLTTARDVMRSEHGIEFRPGPFETLQRATSQETMRRSLSQRRAGIRKLERSVARAQVAAATASAEMRESIERSADLQKLQLASARCRSRKRLPPDA